MDKKKKEGYHLGTSVDVGLFKRLSVYLKKINKYKMKRKKTNRKTQTVHVKFNGCDENAKKNRCVRTDLARVNTARVNVFNFLSRRVAL